jgi:WD40 repeat protein
VERRCEVGELPHENTVAAFRFSPNGSYIVTAGSRSSARLWKVSSAEELVRFSHDSDINDVAFSDDGRYVATGSNDHTARVWEVPGAQEVALLPHPDSVYRVAFSPNRRQLATASWDRVVRLWRWQQQDLLAEACAGVRRNLTAEEWQRHLGEEPYRKTFNESQ